MLTDPAEVAAALVEVAIRYLDRMIAELGPRVIVIDDLHWLDGSSEGMVELVIDTATRAPLVVLAGDPRPTGWSAGWPVRTSPGWTCTAWTSPRRPASRRSSPGPRSRPTMPGASTSGRPATRCSSARPCAPTWRTARSSGATAGWPWPTMRPRRCRSPCGPSSARASMPSSPTPGRPSTSRPVIGIWFRPALVEALLGQDGTALSEATWARLATSSMVLPAEPGGDTWRFAHALIHDAAYAGMLASRRRRLHERVADHLQSRPGAAPAGHIGMHRAAAGDVVRALPLLREAAASAMALGAADEAARLWRRAADLAEPSDAAAAAADRDRAGGRGGRGPRPARSGRPGGPLTAAPRRAAAALPPGPSARSVPRSPAPAAPAIGQTRPAPGRLPARRSRSARRRRPGPGWAPRHTGARGPRAGPGRSGRAWPIRASAATARAMASSGVMWPRSGSSKVEVVQGRLDEQQVHPTHAGRDRVRWAGVAGVAEARAVGRGHDHAPGRDVVAAAHEGHREVAHAQRSSPGRTRRRRTRRRRSRPARRRPRPARPAASRPPGGRWMGRGSGARSPHG